jgi:hypothetical protein
MADFVRFKARGAFAALVRRLPSEWQTSVSSLLESVVFRNELTESISGSSSAIDHGTTQGLNDDDHVQYHNDVRALAWLGTTDITDHATYDHTSLTTIGTNTHAQIDEDIAAAIHDNVDGEINAVSDKSSPVVGDKVLIEDSEDGWSKKSVLLTSIPNCPVYTFITSAAQDEGDLHLSGASWGISKALVKQIKIETSSIDWDLWILQNDNGYVADDATTPAIKLMEGGNGDEVVSIDHPYEDEDASSEVHLYISDNIGSDTFDVWVRGYELR